MRLEDTCLILGKLSIKTNGCFNLNNLFKINMFLGELKKQFTIFSLMLFLLGMTTWVTNSFAVNVPDTSQQSVTENTLSIDKLNDIIDSIKQQRSEIDKKLALLQQAKTDQEKAKIQAEIDEASHSIAEQESSFEMILTGGQALASNDTSEKKEFDWQKDLLEILQPIMSELRQLTEYKRKLDDLQKKKALYKSQIQEINEVLDHISIINKEKLGKDALEQFEQINEKWRYELQENNHLLGVAKLQLDEMVKSQTANEISFIDHIKQFAAGRGATLFMALAAFVAVYFFMSLLWKGFIWVTVRKRNEKWSYYQRVIKLIYHIMMVVLAISAVFYVLSVRNDRLLIALSVLLLVSIIWVLKSSLPRYFHEFKILLNTGAVREGECIIYNGITMKIESLNVYSKLTNPVLPGLRIRLPLADLANYISRPYTEDEPWFPCQVGDYVMLSDGKYGLVKNITSENVLISLYNGMMPQTYPMHDFLAAQPKNFSEGFIVTSVIGLDYKYQLQCTDRIPEILREGIRKGLQQEKYGSSLKDIWVYFAQANSSSLDFKIIAIFDGKVAEDYYPVVRCLQRYAVEVCNQQQWEIPFTQVVVHHNSDMSIDSKNICS